MEAAAGNGVQQAIDELAALPKLPPAAANVWEYFTELDGARGSNGFGPNPLSYRDIDAWQRVTQQALDPWELKTILRLDGLFMTAYAKANQGQGTD